MIKLKVSLKELNEKELTRLILESNRLERETPYDVYFSDTRKPRSSPQNRYLWGIVYKNLSDLWGFPSEDVHEICKTKFLLRTNYDLGAGEIVECPLSTRVLNTVEMTQYIEKIRLWAQEKFGIYIPLPNELTDNDYIQSINAT